MSYPLVSVIIPVYNVEPYLCKALDSVVNQTYHNLEIIVIDDGSTDGSGIICDQYQIKDSRVHVIHQDNQGLSSARNVGIDIMHGEIVAFLDPDDAYLLNMIEALVERLIEDQADIAVCSFHIYYSENGNQASHYDSIYPMNAGVVNSKEALNLLLADKLSVGVWCKLYKKSLFETIRFPDGYVFEDQIITPYLLERADRITMVDQPLMCHWRNRPGSITTTRSEKNICDSYHAQKEKEKFIIVHTPSVYSKEIRNHFVNGMFRSAIVQYLTLFYSEKSYSEEITDFFKEEINERAKEIRQYSMFTKMMYYGYRMNPFFCWKIKCVIQSLKTKLRYPSC